MRSQARTLSQSCGEGSRSLTIQNARGYERWCQKLSEISDRCLGRQVRAADVERDFFQFVQSGQAPLAAEIIRAA